MVSSSNASRRFASYPPALMFVLTLTIVRPATGEPAVSTALALTRSEFCGMFQQRKWLT